MQSQHDPAEDPDAERKKLLIKGVSHDDDHKEEEFDEAKNTDDLVLEKLNFIDKMLEEKLAQLNHTFGRKGKVLEEEIRDLAEERNSLRERIRRPQFRKVSIFSLKLFCFRVKYTDGPYGWLILDLVHSFPKVHGWSLWVVLCNTFSPQLLPKLHGCLMCFALCYPFSP
ncbi:hypothetical protein HanPI659440_Chr17g0669541 [Helianthus annuus]|nr:hypothetical protein HanPI659440_Chr17g0669541 [Helianthus annuus]